MPSITKDEKIALFQEYGGSGTNTGSIEAQVAVLTKRIQYLSEHLKTHKKDHSTRRALLKMVGRRRRLQRYLQRKDIVAYRTFIAKLGLRK